MDGNKNSLLSPTKLFSQKIYGFKHNDQVSRNWNEYLKFSILNNNSIDVHNQTLVILNIFLLSLSVPGVSWYFMLIVLIWHKGFLWYYFITLESLVQKCRDNTLTIGGHWRIANHIRCSWVHPPTYGELFFLHHSSGVQTTTTETGLETHY